MTINMDTVSYPEQYETYAGIKGGERIFIRPIKPEDEPLMQELFDTLSARSIYFRFFSQMKQLPRDMLVRFTHIDYDQEIALGAFKKEEQGEKMLGVSRIIAEPGGEESEFSVLVSDPWQGKGIGAALLSHCLYIAQERGYKHIWGLVLPENKNMLALGRKLEFKVQRCPGSTEYLLKIDLTTLEWRDSKICRTFHKGREAVDQTKRKCFEIGQD